VQQLVNESVELCCDIADANRATDHARAHQLEQLQRRTARIDILLQVATDQRCLSLGAAANAMDLLDQYAVRELRPRAYGRYVDDLLVIDQDRRRLAEVRDAITAYVRSRLQLDIHPGKTRIVNCAAGVDFVGWNIAPHRRSLRRSTVRRANRRIAQRSDDDLLATVNSYLGMARHGDTARVRRRWADTSGLTPDHDCTKVTRSQP